MSIAQPFNQCVRAGGIGNVPHVATTLSAGGKSGEGSFSMHTYALLKDTSQHTPIVHSTILKLFYW